MKSQSLAVLIIALLAACGPFRAGPERPEPGEPALPEIPFRAGPLTLDVVHPPEDGTLAVRDSTFIFGSTGTGRAQLRINGERVPVEPNGAFLAFLPVPNDGTYRLVATADGDTTRLMRSVELPPAPPEPAPDSALIVEDSIVPTGAWAVRPGEIVEVAFQGTAGGRAALIFSDGTRVPLVEEPVDEEASAFEREPDPDEETREPAALSAYRGYFRARPLAAADTAVPWPALAAEPAPHPAGPEAEPAGAVLQLIAGSDTARAPLPLNLAVVDTLRPPVGFAFEPEPPPETSGLVRGSAGPGYTFAYFWPNLTGLTLTGERDGQYRVRLGPDRSAWVPAENVSLRPGGTPPTGGRVGVVRMTPYRNAVDVRIAMEERMPFRVDEDERAFEVTVFGGTGDTGWLQYGGLDPLIERAEWEQAEDDVYRVRVRLSRRAWGYRTFWDENGDLVLRIRRPPEIDPDAPLRGLTIMVDPGHLPEFPGAIGPTRLSELEANVGIARALTALLEAEGARVIRTPAAAREVGLYERRFMADTANAHLFVSVHNNAFPDGVNPFENNGTSTYYFHPHAFDLATALQRELVAELGLRDLGVGRASYAVVRQSWVPAVLTETMFMMMPRQEAALRDPDVRERIARAHLRGLRTFLLERAREP